ncbi:MAG: hypothetical protein JKY95_09950 [Planctomycetaceae bacterium]|nr:hypothetical protein [Planctomycetaceae bacterium]
MPVRLLFAGIFCAGILCSFHVTIAEETVAEETVAEETAVKMMQGLSLVFSENFESGNANHWQPTDSSAWELQSQDGNAVYSLIKKKSNYEPPVRSPYNRSMLKDVVLSDTILDVKLQSTSPEYGHRSLCLFFGYQDESHFYYVHFGKKMDDHANQIFIVNGSPRKKISLTTTRGTDWDDKWHHARVVRKVKTGKIEIYFDDMTKPIMTAEDKTFQWGTVGIGSFDDPGNYDQIRVYGKKKTSGN